MTRAATPVMEQPRSPMVEGFARFWANPNPAVLPSLLADDVVGYFPGDAEPVRGRDAYIAKIAQFLQLLPDLRLEVAEHATNGGVSLHPLDRASYGPKGAARDVGHRPYPRDEWTGQGKPCRL